MSNLKQYLSPTAQHLIDALVESSGTKAATEDSYLSTRAEINAALEKFDADKAALEAYVLRFERKVRRLKNELRENSQLAYPSPATMAGYLAGIIETYLKQERVNEGRETAIAKIIERRLPGTNLKQSTGRVTDPNGQ